MDARPSRHSDIRGACLYSIQMGYRASHVGGFFHPEESRVTRRDKLSAQVLPLAFRLHSCFHGYRLLFFLIIAAVREQKCRELVVERTTLIMAMQVRFANLSIQPSDKSESQRFVFEPVHLPFSQYTRRALEFDRANR